ncbi:MULTISPECIES: hypothetical protein [Bacillus]|uniref:hypothetical protein n=1 Tax=Bacillus TaxID=1386 RepID=UPI001C234941|nr:hypothetical protein [Bacillus pumilus]MBU8573747.1 hypothetical protein [Bacillus pumilus]
MKKKIHYFNTYSVDNLTDKQWKEDVSKHLLKYKEIECYSNEKLPVNEFEVLIAQGYNFWVKQINDAPYYHSDCILVDITLMYTNKAMSFYIDKEYLTNKIYTKVAV